MCFADIFVISWLRLFCWLLQPSPAHIPWSTQSVAVHVSIPAQTLRQEKCVKNTALMDASVLQVMCIFQSLVSDLELNLAMRLTITLIHITPYIQIFIYFKALCGMTSPTPAVFHWVHAPVFMEDKFISLGKITQLTAENGESCIKKGLNVKSSLINRCYDSSYCYYYIIIII